MRRLSARKVRRLRRWIKANRCPGRPGLTHDWVPVEAVLDSTQFAPPLELIGYSCAKCGLEEVE